MTQQHTMDELALVKSDKAFQQHRAKIELLIEQSRPWLYIILISAFTIPVFSFWLYFSLVEFSSLNTLSIDVEALRKQQILIAFTAVFICLLIVFSALQYSKHTRLINKLIREQRDIYLHTSHTDALTGALNRRSFKIVYDTSEAQLKRHNLKFSLISIDIDHFKSINDKFGHQLGDKVLIETVSRLKGVIRINDHLARMGGEEFVVLCTVKNLDDTTLIAEKLRKEAESITLFSTNQDKVSFTISLGIYHVKSEDDIDSALRAADIALYHAKKQGRNQAVNYEPTLANV